MNPRTENESKSTPERSGAATTRPGAEARREQILNAAAESFASNGFRGTTTRAIAERVGITEAALYRYYPSKEALYSAIVSRKTATPDPTEGVGEAARTGDDRAVFAGLAGELVRRVRSDPGFLRILLYTSLEGHKLSEPLFAARVMRTRNFLARYISKRIADGAFREMDPQLAAHAFLGMVFHHLLIRDVFAQEQLYPQPVEQAVETFVSLFLDGLRTPERRSTDDH